MIIQLILKPHKTKTTDNQTAVIYKWPYSQTDIIRNRFAKIKVKHKKKA